MCAMPCREIGEQRRAPIKGKSQGGVPMSALRWLRGRLFGRPDMPRRWTWLLIFATCQTVGSWTIGRLWAP